MASSSMRRVILRILQINPNQSYYIKSPNRVISERSERHTLVIVLGTTSRPAIIIGVVICLSAKLLHFSAVWVCSQLKLLQITCINQKYFQINGQRKSVSNSGGAARA